MWFASELLNCAAPDTGNMEILNAYASDEVRRRWLAPLLEGEIRSAFSMTEPDVASSDATNIGLRMERRGDSYVLNGRKWFSSGAGRDRCEVLIVMARSNPDAPRPPPAVDDRGAQGHARRVDRPHPARVRLRPRRRPPGDRLRRRGGAGRQPPRRGGRRLRHRPGAARSRPHPPLHAHDRRGRAGPRADGRPRPRPFDVRIARGREGADPGLDRRVAHRHRHGPPVRAAHRPPDGHRRQQGGGHRHLRASRSPCRTSPCG